MKKLKKEHFIIGIITIIFGLTIGVLSLFSQYNSENANAGYEQNDSEGYFLIDFINNQLLLSQIGDNIEINTDGGYATLSGGIGISGNFITSPIEPISFSSWEDIEYEANYINTDDMHG